MERNYGRANRFTATGKVLLIDTLLKSNQAAEAVFVAEEYLIQLGESLGSRFD